MLNTKSSSEIQSTDLFNVWLAINASRNLKFYHLGHETTSFNLYSMAQITVGLLNVE